MAYWLPLVAFGTLVLAAAVSAWRVRCLRVVVVALVGSFVLSNLAFFFAPIAHRPGVFTMTEVVLIVASWAAWLECRDRALIALVAISVVSIMANVAFAAGVISPARLYSHELMTNILFAMECLIVIGMGVADRARAGDLGAGAAGRRYDPQLDAGAE